MDVIHYTTTLKADGAEYKKIVFWNRFLRNKLELILTCLPALASIVLLFFGFHSLFMIMIYIIFWAYPIYIYYQFQTGVAYHLKYRDESENAPCMITFMYNGILAEIPDFNLKHVYYWEDFTTIYDKLGYYMMFNKGTMLVMLKKEDIPDDMKEPAIQFIKQTVDQNTCLLKF